MKCTDWPGVTDLSTPQLQVRVSTLWTRGADTGWGKIGRLIPDEGAWMWTESMTASCHGSNPVGEVTVSDTQEPKLTLLHPHGVCVGAGGTQPTHTHNQDLTWEMQGFFWITFPLQKQPLCKSAPVMRHPTRFYPWLYWVRNCTWLLLFVGSMFVNLPTS